MEQAPAEVAPLLDDAHVLVDRSSEARLLAELRALPANGQLVMARRAEPAVGWSRLATDPALRLVRWVRSERPDALTVRYAAAGRGAPAGTWVSAGGGPSCQGRASALRASRRPSSI